MNLRTLALLLGTRTLLFTNHTVSDSRDTGRQSEQKHDTLCEISHRLDPNIEVGGGASVTLFAGRLLGKHFLTERVYAIQLKLMRCILRSKKCLLRRTKDDLWHLTQGHHAQYVRL